MIAFTSDIDWATDEVIQDMLSIFEKYKVKCTLFVTHHSKVIDNCNRELFEIGIHPNFNFLLSGEPDKSVDEIIKDLLKIYPEAIGTRSHGMTQSTPLLDAFKRNGLKYDCNTFLPYKYDVFPFVSWNGLLRIPYNWEDDIHYLYNKSFEESHIINYSLNEFHVLDFHPIHVYLNTDTEQCYLNAKPHYKFTDKIEPHKNCDNHGTRDYLENTLKYISENNLTTYHLKEIYQKFI